MKVKRVRVVLLINTSIVLILMTGWCGGNTWVKTRTRTAGLWKVCSKYDGRCFPRVVHKSIKIHKAVKAFTIISCLGAIAAVLSSVFMVCVGEINGKYVFILLMVTSFSAVMSLCLFIPHVDDYLHRHNGSNFEYGWCFILGWIGVVWSIVSAFNSCFVVVTPVEEKQPIML